MVAVRFDMTDGRLPGRGLTGYIELVPVRLDTDPDDATITRAAAREPLVDAVATIDIVPGVWRVREGVDGGEYVVHVLVPDMPAAEYADESVVVRVDPATLDPLPPAVAWWESALDAEAATRAAADAAETAARSDADTALTVALAAEGTARTDADTALTTALTAEENTRAAADTALTATVAAKADQSALTAEATARGDADTALTTQVTDLAAQKGAAGGLAPLDAGSKIAAVYLPSYVDDVLEYASVTAFPAAGEPGVLYVALDAGDLYRWSGTGFVEIVASPGSTDAVPEGAANLYYTNARADARVAAADATGSGALVRAIAPSIANAVLTGTVTVPDAALAIADTSGLQAALDLLNASTRSAVLAANEPAVNNSAAPVATGLTLAAVAAGTYLLDAYLVYGSSTAADFRATLTVPTGTTGQWSVNGVSSTSDSSTSTASFVSTSIVNALFPGGVGIGPVVYARFTGTLVITTAGTVTINYAQAVADATNTTLRAASWLRLAKIN